MSIRFGRAIFRSFSVILLMAAATFAANRIDGGVYDNKNNPLVDVYVELLNEFGSGVRHTQTDATGRYTFLDIANGRWGVRVRPYRYDFDEQTKTDIEFSSFSVLGGTGSSSETVDFMLTPRRNSLAYAEASVVFAQEIPSDAKKLVADARNLKKKKDFDGAIAQYEAAVKIFPRYFEARFSLGELYIGKKDWDNAKANLLVAADVNPKSPRSFYMLGVVLSAIGDSVSEPAFNKAALMSLSQALVLSPGSTEILLLLGHVEMAMTKFEDAEKHLQQAKKVSANPNPEIYKSLSILYAQYMKRFNEAANELEGYIKALPESDSPERKKEVETYKKLVKQWRERAAKVQSPDAPKTTE